MREKISLLLIVGALFLCNGCSGQESYPSDYPDSPAQTKEDIRWPVFPQEQVLTDGSFAQIDYSHINDGYIGAKLLQETEGIKLQIMKDEKKYNYDLQEGEYTAFPVQMGDGAYVLKLLKQVSGNRYAVMASCQVKVALEDERAMYLYPNQVVDYDKTSAVLPLSFDIVKEDQDDLSRILHLYEYVVEHIRYDDQKAVEATSAYMLPDIDAALEEGKGICFDYASTLAALCRIQGIPARVIVGWTDIEYHAWVEIYLEGEGWINPKLFFAKESWTRTDPTFAASGADYEGKYEEVYRY